MASPDPDLIADCSKCFGLCCIALRFDRADGFGHDKAAGQPCHFLQTDFRCSIHERRDALGYEGCGEFDCLGAGQRASAAFAGRNWQRDAGVARELYARFAELLRLQEMRQALIEASELDLPPDLELARQSRLSDIASLADEVKPTSASSVSAALVTAWDVLEQIAVR
jgi:hypothetical protein